MIVTKVTTKITGMTLTRKIKPSVIDQLKEISTTLLHLEYYCYDVDGDDLTDAIFYSKLQDTINDKIEEIEND